MKKIQIVILNMLVIGLSGFLLFEQFNKEGKFEWVNSNEIKDGDELYLNVISAFVLIMGLISILTQIFYDQIFHNKGKSENHIISKIINFINGVYGGSIFFVGFGFFIMLFGNLGSNPINDIIGVISLVMIFLVLLSFCYLGILILKQSFFREETLIGQKEEDILDNEVY